MDAPQGLIWVGAQRPEVGVLAVGGHQNGVGKGRLPDLHHDRIMGKDAAGKAELDKIPRLQFTQSGFRAKGPRPAVLSGQKVIKVGHAAPGWRFLISADVVPSEGRRMVHHAAPSIKALGCEVGAVSPQFREIVVRRIPIIRPPVGIAHRSPAVIGQDIVQRTSPLSCPHSMQKTVPGSSHPKVLSPSSHHGPTGWLWRTRYEKRERRSAPFSKGRSSIRPCRRSPAR